MCGTAFVCNKWQNLLGVPTENFSEVYGFYAVKNGVCNVFVNTPQLAFIILYFIYIQIHIHAYDIMVKLKSD